MFIFNNFLHKYFEIKYYSYQILEREAYNWYLAISSGLICRLLASDRTCEWIQLIFGTKTTSLLLANEI